MTGSLSELMWRLSPSIGLTDRVSIPCWSVWTDVVKRSSFLLRVAHKRQRTRNHSLPWTWISWDRRNHPDRWFAWVVRWEVELRTSRVLAYWYRPRTWPSFCYRWVPIRYVSSWWTYPCPGTHPECSLCLSVRKSWSSYTNRTQCLMSKRTHRWWLTYQLLFHRWSGSCSCPAVTSPKHTWIWLCRQLGRECWSRAYLPDIWSPWPVQSKDGITSFGSRYSNRILRLHRGIHWRIWESFPLYAG